MRWLWPAATLALVVAAPCNAQGKKKLEARQVTHAWKGGTPSVSFSARDLADARVREELKSGLRKRLVLTTQAYVDGSKALIATQQVACAVTYDLWEGAFIVQAGEQRQAFAELNKVIERCLTVADLSIGKSKQYVRHKDRSIFFAVRAEFNPITKKQCRALVRSSPGQDPIGPIVVNIVRRRICGAERSVQFRSQSIVVPP